MQEKDLLDSDLIEVTLHTGPEYRIPAILLEGIFLLITFIGLIFGPLSLAIIGASSLAMVYMTFSWYLFKAAKFRGWDIALSIISGLILNVGCLGVLFKKMNWEGSSTMTNMVLVTCTLGIIITAGWYQARKENQLEYRLSLKLLSRFALFLLGVIVF